MGESLDKLFGAKEEDVQALADANVVVVPITITLFEVAVLTAFQEDLASKQYRASVMAVPLDFVGNVIDNVLELANRAGRAGVVREVDGTVVKEPTYEVQSAETGQTLPSDVPSPSPQE